MSDIVIKAENLGKKYTIGGPSVAPLDVARDKLRTGKQERYRTPSTKLPFAALGTVVRAGLREPVTAPLRCLSSVVCGQSSAIESRRITCIIS